MKSVLLENGLSWMRLLPVPLSLFLCFALPFPLSGHSLMFFIKLTRSTSTLSPWCLHNIVYNSGCAEFHFIPGPYTYRSLVCSLSSLFRPSTSLLSIFLSRFFHLCISIPSFRSSMQLGNSQLDNPRFFLCSRREELVCVRHCARASS